MATRASGRGKGTMLTIRNLHAKAGGKDILRGIDLEVKAGEVHAARR
jgi:Fe-S cluster assembly ATPase SufC